MAGRTIQDAYGVFDGDTRKLIGFRDGYGREQLVPTYAYDPNGNIVALAEVAGPNAAPSAVQSLVATAGQSLVILKWLPPAYGQPTSYTVTTTPATTTTTVTPTTANGQVNATISGLANNTAYTFTVTPINAAGSGTAATSASVTPKTAPTGLSAVTGLALWYDASQESYGNGASVTSLTDWSGNGASTTGVSASNPLFVASWTNSKPGVAFTSAGSKFFKCGITQQTIGSKCTIFWVGQFDSVTGAKRMFSFRDSAAPGSTQGGVLDHNGSTARAFADSNTINATFAISITTPYIFSWVPGSFLYRNGAKGSNALGYPPYLGGTEILYLNSDFGTNFFGDQTMGEFLIFNRELTQAERWLVEAYLGTKYNISVTQA